MKRTLYIIFLLLSLYCVAQPPSNFFTTFGGTGDDVAYSVKVTLDGNYITVGSTSSYGYGGTDVYLVKLDTMGNTIWAKTYGGVMSEVGKSVIQLSDSGFVIAGYTSSFGSGGYDAYMIRTDKVGNLLWQRSFGGSDWDFANDVCLGPDGHLYIVGYTYSFGAGKKDGFVLKYDLTGQLILQKTVGGIENEELNAVLKAADNSLVLAGYTESKDDPNGDCYFLKMDTNLDTIYTKTFGGPYRDFLSDVMQKSSGDFIVCGAKTYTAGGNTHSYFYRMTNNGTFVLDGDDFRNDGDEFFVSTANSTQSEDFTAFVRTCSFPSIPGIKKQIDVFISYPNGSSYIVNSTGGSNDEYVYSIENTKDGGFIVVGSAESYGGVGAEAFIVKLDSTIINKASIVGLIDQKSVNCEVRYQNFALEVIFPSATEHGIEVSSVMGHVIYRKDTKEQRLFIDLSNEASSIYLLKIFERDGNVMVKKVIR